MGRRLVALLMMVAALGLGAGPRTWTTEQWFDKPRSPRIANYRIEATLDFEHKTLEGRETLSWRNTGTAPTRELPLHLYLNAFKGPQSLLMKESEGRLGPTRQERSREAASWGYCRLISARMEGRELSGHDGEDETVRWLNLPRAVAPGETIHLEITWENRYPKVFARSGWAGNFLMSGQWFPKVGVYQGDRWNCHAYHANTEYFADFGVYDVALSLPNALGLAHTGTQTNFVTEIEKDPQRPLNVIWRLHAEDVHDFAWAVMPEESWRKPAMFEYRGVQVFYYIHGPNRGNFQRQRRAVENALRWSEEWYFKYPYPTLTVIDTPDDASGADGMEYPTLITSGSVAFDPLGLRLVPEGVAIHEFGHQFFYGLLASNEFEEPWLDEGFTSWFTHKAMERSYHSLLGGRRFQVGTDFGAWAGYWMEPSSDPLTRFGFKTISMQSSYIAAYDKSTLVLNQLEALLGRPVMEQVMRAYAQEMAFRHPTRQDFRRIAERISGRDLGGFWRDFVEGTEILDYVIRGVKERETTQGGWLFSDKAPVFAAPQPATPGKVGSITLERKGGIRVPITLWVRLENREEQRLVWDGQDRWITYEFGSPVAAAVLDPDGNYPMLKDRLHASYTPRPVRRGFHYWSQMVWGAVAGWLQGCGIG
ncbi:MAG: M1 family metallopeptidase [Holophagaceae bacterium]|uniref:M1 family metallopeptidase n=1 Tax=Candidatus Geothrix skivensis TaxID=2954439 RepID=A0A9D7SFT8_9BACT|nr:M1 family metallopeptidase [Candidatus Geothrix skivensis]